MFLGPADAVNVQPAAAHQVHPEVCRHQDHIHPQCFPRTSHRCKWVVNKYLVFIVFFKKSIKNYFADSLMIFFLIYSTYNYFLIQANKVVSPIYFILLFASRWGYPLTPEITTFITQWTDLRLEKYCGLEPRQDQPQPPCALTLLHHIFLVPVMLTLLL